MMLGLTATDCRVNELRLRERRLEAMRRHALTREESTSPRCPSALARVILFLARPVRRLAPQWGA